MGTVDKSFVERTRNFKKKIIKSIKITKIDH